MKRILEKKKRSTIANLYRYSDLSVEATAEQVDIKADKVQEIIDGLTKSEALEVLINQSLTNVEQIMTPKVISLDGSKTVRDAAGIMA